MFIHRCGDAKEDILSAYCLHRGCKQSGDLAPNEPICARRLPHDIHGCIKVKEKTHLKCIEYTFQKQLNIHIHSISKQDISKKEQFDMRGFNVLIIIGCI